MNGPVRRVAAGAARMFVALLVNRCVFAIAREPGLDSNPLNRRERDVEFAQDRGLILVGDVPVATTTPIPEPDSTISRPSSSRRCSPRTECCIQILWWLNYAISHVPLRLFRSWDKCP